MVVMCVSSNLVVHPMLLSSHMLPDRLSKGEEIFFFCFNFLKHIVSEKFSAIRKPRRKNSHFKDNDFTMEDLCQLKSRDRGSVTSLSSDFSLITEETGGGGGAAASSLTSDGADLLPSQASSWKKSSMSSPQTVVWSKAPHLEDHLYHPLGEGITRAGSSPLAVPGRRLATEYPRSGSSLSTEYGSWQIVFQDEGPSGRMCRFPSERQARLEAVRELFLAAYSSTVGLKSSAPSPSGAISGLLEQFARGVGLRGTNSIV
ncbi:hypothetical protein NHX12_030146 [Muraenolepis orangiensis]|uniref:Uncharacterized protein n=1 Tax=Muraenolepis orangiensis TaxID=630683 RepID=A0A9Q0E8Y3_9TELE|nr:hypothetical protein NHX12_030146 [Muraenolepis orangiensis]